jgi:hypothetical protein
LGKELRNYGDCSLLNTQWSMVFVPYHLGTYIIRFNIGIVNNWHDMEKIWQYIYTEELKSASEDVMRFM